MSHQIAYYRVSTSDQSIDAQRSAMGGPFDQEFQDLGVSGAVPAANRPGFAAMLNTLRAGDTVHVYAIGRPFAADAAGVREWRKANAASIAETARKFGLSLATVKRYCAQEA